MGRARSIVVAMMLAAGATGCTLLAGVDDIEYGPETTTSKTEPKAKADGGAQANAEADADVDADADAEAEAVADADAGADADADAEEPPPPPPAVADDPCTGPDFAANDHRGPFELRVITFPALPSDGAHYSPSCLRIREGQSVTFAGNFTAYPLDPLGPEANVSPIASTAGGVTATFVFPKKGRFAFGSIPTATMRGAIEVK